MKRSSPSSPADEVACVEPEEKKQRLDAPMPSIDGPWYFVTSGEDGACYNIKEWRPPTKEAAEVLFTAHAKSKSCGLHLARVMSWLGGHAEKPVGFASGLECADFGSFVILVDWHDAGGLFLNGPMFFYSDWK